MSADVDDLILPSVVSLVPLAIEHLLVIDIVHYNVDKLKDPSVAGLVFGFDIGR